MVDTAGSVPKITLRIRSTRSFGRHTRIIATVFANRAISDFNVRFRASGVERSIASMEPSASVTIWGMEQLKSFAIAAQQRIEGRLLLAAAAKPSQPHTVHSCQITMDISFVSMEDSVVWTRKCWCAGVCSRRWNMSSYLISSHGIPTSNCRQQSPGV
jgi:hypothetical protein